MWNIVPSTFVHVCESGTVSFLSFAVPRGSSLQERIPTKPLALFPLSACASSPQHPRSAKGNVRRGILSRQDELPGFRDTYPVYFLDARGRSAGRSRFKGIQFADALVRPSCVLPFAAGFSW